MTDPPIPYGRQWVDERDICAVVEALNSDFLTTGPRVEAFEAALAGACGAGHAVAVSSGTAALHCMYFAAGLGPGDEMVTSPLTFVATASAALHLGATVRLADVQPDTGNLDPKAVEEVLGERTRLVVPVDYAGHPADYEELGWLSDRFGFTLVADAAHSLGARYRGMPVGTLAHASAFSFHPVKPITTAEGGAVVTDDQGLADRAARYRTHGVRREPSKAQPWYYEQLDLGLNYRLSDLHAALGRSQLTKLEEFVQRRCAIAGRYVAGLADIDGLSIPQVRADVEPGWHLFVIRVTERERRSSFFNKLRELGLGVQVHYTPVHHHPYFQELGFRPGMFPGAEDFSARAVSLPVFPKMSDSDVDRVIAAVRRAAAEVL